MVSFGVYAALSTLALATTVGYAKHTREQFYSTVIFLVDTKICVCVLCNFALVLAIMCGKMFKSLFFGRLRSGEVNTMMDKARYAVVETCLTLIIFREEISVKTVALFTALLFTKIFHWLGSSRLEYIEQSQITGRFAYGRLGMLLLLLLLVDSLFLNGTVDNSFNASGEFVPSVLIYFGFESSILITAAFSTLMKFGLHLIEISSSGQWHNKSIYKFYLELFINATRSVLYIIFFVIIFVYYGLPMHLIRDLWLSLKNLVKEWHQFRRYRKLCANMHQRFPDATAEQLEEHPDCIICREQMIHGEHAKVLPCGHIFHFYCLRSWMERQQTCPYCRANIPEDTTTTMTPTRRIPSPRAQQQQPQQQGQQQEQVNNMLPGFDADGRPMMAPDEAARRAAFTSRNMRNIRFMTQPRRFPIAPSSSQQQEQEEKKEQEEKNNSSNTNDRGMPTPANFQASVAAPVTPRLLQQVSASSTTSATSISTPALRVTPSFRTGNVPLLLTPLPLAPPLTPTPSPGIVTGSPIEVQLQQMQIQMSSLQRQVQELITLQRASTSKKSSSSSSTSNNDTEDMLNNNSTTSDLSPSAQIRRRRLQYFQKKENET